MSQHSKISTPLTPINNSIDSEVIPPESVPIKKEEEVKEENHMDFQMMINEYLKELIGRSGVDANPPTENQKPVNKSPLSRSVRSQNWSSIDQSTIRNVDLVHDGKVMSIPERIQCHLCHEGIMVLTVRKAYNRKVLKQYPAYRCGRKRCQTFRSIFKHFHMMKEVTNNQQTTKSE
uniref:C2H2-type domain-containing protein n=1 Tax=Caenorhabditis tropicalis TaxID=1561998 RepID=A0A1I7UFF6_9PELO